MQSDPRDGHHVFDTTTRLFQTMLKLLTEKTRARAEPLNVKAMYFAVHCGQPVDMNLNDCHRY